MLYSDIYRNIDRWGNMLKSIRWPIVTIVFILSLITIFGGYFIFQDTNIKNPIVSSLEKIEAISINNLNINNKIIELNISIDSTDDFQSTYTEILAVLSKYQGMRSIEINIDNNANSKMISAWNSSYFYIAEAIEQNEYSLIPSTINRLKQEEIFDNGNSTMDEENIYIDLHQGDLGFYIVIPTRNEIEVNTSG